MNPEYIIIQIKSDNYKDTRSFFSNYGKKLVKVRTEMLSGRRYITYAIETKGLTLDDITTYAARHVHNWFIIDQKEYDGHVLHAELNKGKRY